MLSFLILFHALWVSNKSSLIKTNKQQQKKNSEIFIVNKTKIEYKAQT